MIDLITTEQILDELFPDNIGIDNFKSKFADLIYKYDLFILQYNREPKFSGIKFEIYLKFKQYSEHEELKLRIIGWLLADIEIYNFKNKMWTRKLQADECVETLDFMLGNLSKIARCQNDSNI